MKKTIKNKAESIRAKLMDIARAGEIDFDALLLRYFQERFIYRLTNSKFSDYFVLKGGLLLICFNMPRSRPTKDIDLLAEKIKNDPEELELILADIVSVPCNDGIKFISSSITSECIKEDAEYEGIRLKIDGTLGQARKKLQIDVGFGDIIIPGVIHMNFPCLLDEAAPQVKAYSIESVISEKLEAMIKLGVLNSRMKDFYDVYLLSSTYDFSSDNLQKAIVTTFKQRQTPIPDNPIVFLPEFHEDKGRQKQWVAFLKKTRLNTLETSFEQVMKRITVFLKPLLFTAKWKNKLWVANKGTWQ